MRASDDDIDLTIWTSGQQKVQLVARIRFRSLYHSGNIQIRVLDRKGSSMISISMITFICNFLVEKIGIDYALILYL